MGYGTMIGAGQTGYKPEDLSSSCYNNTNQTTKEKLKTPIKRYENKVKWLQERQNQKNYWKYEGIIDGLETAINDMNDILNDLEV